MKLKWLVAAAAVVILVGSMWFLLRTNRIDDDKAKAVASWLHSVRLKPGLNANVKLPAQFNDLAASGSVDVMLSQNNKLAYFLRTKKGFKGNYQGYIYVESGYPFIITNDSYGRSTIDIFSDGNSSVIDKKISNNVYAVFFDLN